MKKTKPLLKCSVIHSLRGRTRIHCRALKFLGEKKLNIERDLRNIHDINSVECSPITGNVLLKYNFCCIEADEVLELVEAVISTYSLLAFKAERESMNRLTVIERRLQEESTGPVALRLAVTAGTLFYFTVKNSYRSYAQGWLGKFANVPGVVSLALSAPIMKSGLLSIYQNKRPNADTLTTASIITSLLTGSATSALTTILLSDIAEFLTAYTMGRTRKAITDMVEIGDDTVWKRNKDGALMKVQVSAIELDDIVYTQTGDKISVDGEVAEGEAVVDQSSITGEFMPASKTAEDRVYAGTVVKSGSIFIRAKKIGDDTAAARIVHLVEEAASNKAQIQVYADRFSAQLIPFNFALAGLVFLFTKSASRALNMMIIDYSCGMRLSTATALSACIHNAARHGVLIKGGNFIEIMSEADTLILDKTGTMTEGKPRVVTIIPCHGYDDKALLCYAAAAEETSNHPLANSILEKTRKAGWQAVKHGKTRILVGKGVETETGDGIVRVGNKKLMHEHAIDLDILQDDANTLARRGELVVYVALDDLLIGIISLQDSLRENMKKSLNRLRHLGFDDVRLLTGDVTHHAAHVATKMAMDDFSSELMPEDKAKTVLQLQSQGTKIIMIGDGINDAPALAYADVGIAIGNQRTDIAIEAADVTITGDDPLLIPAVIGLSRKTMGIVRGNFSAVIGINSLGIVMSVLGFLPVIWASVMHNMSTILVVLNSGRLLLEEFER